MKITYTRVGDYYLPNLVAPESPKVGRWGMLRFNYLRKHRETLYTIMLIHLDIFLKLDSTYEAVYTPLKHTAGITSLKTDDARGDFLWRTEETILSVRFGQIAGIC